MREKERHIMKSVFKVLKALLISFVLIVVAFGILCVIGCLDYVNRCVKITPRDNIKAVEMNKLYSIEDFFLIEREEDISRRKIDIRWEEGSSGSNSDIRIKENGQFTVTGGTGILSISLEDRNHNSPEGSYKSVKLPVVSGTA